MTEERPNAAGLARLNALGVAGAERRLLACCGARDWARRLAAERPFPSREELLAAADRVWWGLAPEDWLEAFAAHPRIGERPRSGGRAGRWSRQEQSAAAGASASTEARLAAANRAYEARFGHLFIVCASGRTAGQMLALLEERLDNDPAAELRVAAGEQAAITRLRLAKLLADLDGEAQGDGFTTPPARKAPTGGKEIA